LRWIFAASYSEAEATERVKAQIDIAVEKLGGNLCLLPSPENISEEEELSWHLATLLQLLTEIQTEEKF